ncbi:MAG: VOC family protein [Armatimonadota bacterium]|nr:VOC family protein [Armatimonadota bacterium]
MHPDMELGWVHLSVADLERSAAFYEGVVGLQILRRSPGFIVMGVEKDGATGSQPVPLVLLTHWPGAQPKPAHCRGLYHFALCLPTRRDLARAAVRLVRRRWPIDGAADHWVSEAIYLLDPDGHGIELYADRPRDQWPRRGEKILMTTEPLDWDGLMTELPPEERRPGIYDDHAGSDSKLNGMPSGTRLGHIHLHVSSLERAERFYREALGLDLVLRFGSGALFFSAGGYHHHIGANIWIGQDAPPPPSNTVQLLHFSLVLPSPDDVLDLARRLGQARAPVESLAHLGLEVFESVVLKAPVSRKTELQEGFVTRDEDGFAIAVVSAGGRRLERSKVKDQPT